MVDEDLLEENHLARTGLQMLHASGVLREQITRITQSFLEGDADESIEDVTARVINSRRQIVNLRTLDDLGAQYTQGEES